MTNIIMNNNDLVLYSLTACIVCLATGYFIKSYYFTTQINSPPTFNLNLEQLKEVQDILDRGEELDKETQTKLDEDFQNILGDNFEQYHQEMQLIQDEFERELQDILNNELLNIHCPLESTDLYFNTPILELIDIINNLITHVYF